ncbi:zf-HC2 domain-containing protein [Tissierella sp.]|uniref:zf-HC2 domain-containing protein n=1 Tax=Tissierella sp. TaxID=41274 RepID=UPI0028A91BC3|nr:zf-HC2 domain-containing protein [Tissierella sp.]
MKNISCDIILDLIPLVKDGVASEDSEKIVNEHLKYCNSCKAEFEIFEPIKFKQSLIEDKKIIFAIKRSIVVTQIIILIVGTVVGVGLTNSMGMFYNFIIMPIIGGVSFITLRRKWYFMPIVVFILSYIWQIIDCILSGEFVWEILYAGLFFSTIYAVLVGLGLIIAVLLEFAFRKER